jgi:hypothetical protein
VGASRIGEAEEHRTPSALSALLYMRGQCGGGGFLQDILLDQASTRPIRSGLGLCSPSRTPNISESRRPCSKLAYLLIGRS